MPIDSIKIEMLRINARYLSQIHESAKYPNSYLHDIINATKLMRSVVNGDIHIMTIRQLNKCK